MNTVKDLVNGVNNPYCNWLHENKEDVEFLYTYGFAAFSSKQFEEGLESLKQKGYFHEGDKLRPLGMGLYILTCKADEFFKLNKAAGKTLKSRLKDKNFAYAAFLYEMANHEYQLDTYEGDWGVVSCFCSKELEFSETKNAEDYLTECGLSDVLIIDAWNKAKRDYLRFCYDNDWY